MGAEGSGSSETASVNKSSKKSKHTGSTTSKTARASSPTSTLYEDTSQASITTDRTKWKKKGEKELAFEGIVHNYLMRVASFLTEVGISSTKTTKKRKRARCNE
uniref:Uncharacterized protein n=1 Tax=Palpitomonas bilix TaxID=652834 RepID=A0A7S3GD30_9EUKA